MINWVLEAFDDDINSAKEGSSVSGVLVGAAGGRPITEKSLAEIVRMPERRRVVPLYCCAVGVGAEFEDVGALGT